MKRNTLVPGTYHHIILRGARGMKIFLDEQDWWECNLLLYHLNDSFVHSQWKRDLQNFGGKIFQRPVHWPPRERLVDICAYCIHSNHAHILVYEFKEGGVSSFMRRFPKVLTHRFNKKYDGVGSIFQGPYQLRTISSEEDLRNVALYIMAKNVMERFPRGGIKGALKNFEDAWVWGNSDNFSSFPDFGAGRETAILRKENLAHFWGSEKDFKREVLDYLAFHNT